MKITIFLFAISIFFVSSQVHASLLRANAGWLGEFNPVRVRESDKPTSVKVDSPDNAMRDCGDACNAGKAYHNCPPHIYTGCEKMYVKGYIQPDRKTCSTIKPKCPTVDIPKPVPFRPLPVQPAPVVEPKETEEKEEPLPPQEPITQPPKEVYVPVPVPVKEEVVKEVVKEVKVPVKEVVIKEVKVPVKDEKEEEPEKPEKIDPCSNVVCPKSKHCHPFLEKKIPMKKLPCCAQAFKCILKPRECNLNTHKLVNGKCVPNKKSECYDHSCSKKMPNCDWKKGYKEIAIGRNKNAPTIEGRCCARFECKQVGLPVPEPKPATQECDAYKCPSETSPCKGRGMDTKIIEATETADTVRGRCCPAYECVKRPPPPCGTPCDWNPCPKGHLFKSKQHRETKEQNGLKWLIIKTEKIRCRDKHTVGYIQRDGKCGERKPKCFGNECSDHSCSKHMPYCEKDGMDTNTIPPRKDGKTVEERCCNQYECTKPPTSCGKPCTYNPCPTNRFHKKMKSHKDFASKGLDWEQDNTVEIMCFKKHVHGYLQRDGKTCRKTKPICFGPPVKINPEKDEPGDPKPKPFDEEKPEDPTPQNPHPEKPKPLLPKPVKPSVKKSVFGRSETAEEKRARRSAGLKAARKAKAGKVSKAKPKAGKVSKAKPEEEKPKPEEAKPKAGKGSKAKPKAGKGSKAKPEEEKPKPEEGKPNRIGCPKSAQKCQRGFKLTWKRVGVEAIKQSFIELFGDSNKEPEEHVNFKGLEITHLNGATVGGDFKRNTDNYHKIKELVNDDKRTGAVTLTLHRKGSKPPVFGEGSKADDSSKGATGSGSQGSPTGPIPGNKMEQSAPIPPPPPPESHDRCPPVKVCERIKCPRSKLKTECKAPFKRVRTSQIVVVEKDDWEEHHKGGDMMVKKIKFCPPTYICKLNPGTKWGKSKILQLKERIKRNQKDPDMEEDVEEWRAQLREAEDEGLDDEYDILKEHPVKYRL